MVQFFLSALFAQEAQPYCVPTDDSGGFESLEVRFWGRKPGALWLRVGLLMQTGGLFRQTAFGGRNQILLPFF